MHALSKRPDEGPDRTGDPRVVSLESEDCADVLSAVASDTARAVLLALQDRPATASEIADDLETSIQNVKYHLGKLVEAGLVDVIDRVYSKKGREMKVYATAANPLLLVAGSEAWSEESAGPEFRPEETAGTGSQNKLRED